MSYSGIEWIGNIPSTWNLIKTKYCFVNKKYIPGKLSKNYQRLALTLSGVIIRNKEDTEGLQPKDFDSYQLVNEGNLVFKLIDLQNISTSRVGLSFYTGLVSPAYIVLQKLTSSSINLKFSEYYFLMMWFRSIFNELGDNGVRSSLSANDLLNIYICVPPIKEQNKIAKFLDGKCAEIDSLVADIQKEISILEEYKKSVITESVTKGIVQNVEMKNSGINWIGKIPKTWTISRLKFLLKKKMKYGASETGVDYSAELPRYVRITDILPNNKLKEENKLSLTKEQSKGFILEDGTVLFARSGGTVGKTFLYNSQMGVAAYAGYLISAIANSCVLLPEWLFYFSLSSSYLTWVELIFSQSTIQNINADKYSNMPLTLPPIEEQKSICSFLKKACSEIDKAISEKQSQLDLLAEYKKSLIYEYVTGKKEVI